MRYPVLAFRRMLFLAAIAVLLIGGWMGIYASSRGLTQSWRDAIRREFAKQGLPLSLGQLTLDPIHGLVARNVRFYDDPDQKRVLADISQIDLDVSLAKLLRKQVSLNRLHVRNARASIPLEPGSPDGERLEISDFSARVLFSDDRIEVQEMRGRLHGLLCSLTGELVRKPAAGGPKPVPQQRPEIDIRRLSPGQSKAVVEALSVLRRMNWEKGRPAELQIRAKADLGDLEAGRFEFSFHAPVLAWDDIRVEEVGLRGRYEAGLLQAEDVRFRDNGGTFRAEADFVRATRTLRFNLDSRAAALERVRRHWWPKELPTVVLEAPPILTAGGKLVLPKDWQSEKPQGLVTGSLALGRFQFNQVPVEYASASFSSDGDRFLLRDIRLRQGEGTLEASLALENGIFRARGTTTIRPAGVASLSPDSNTRQALEAVACGPASSLRFDFFLTGRPAVAESWSLDSSFEATDVRYHGIPVRRARSGLQVEWGLVRFANPEAEIPAGAPFVAWPGTTPAPTLAKARSIDIHPGDPRGVTTSFEALQCDGWPHTVVACFHPPGMVGLPPCRFESPVHLNIDGIIGADLKAVSNLKVTARGDGLAYWPFLDRDLPLEKPKVALTIKEAQVEITSLEAGFLGGRLNGVFLIRDVHRPPPGCRGRVMLSSVSYPDLLTLFKNQADQSKGTLDLLFDFDSPKCDLAGLNGRGNMALREADLFSIPLFGPLSPLVEAVLPDLGLGYSVASTAGCSYTVRDGILTTDDFSALTPSFKMDGQGTVNLLTNGVDFSTRLNARGLAKLATYVLSYIFEYKCEGTLAEPLWRPVHIPRLPKLDLPSLLPGAKKEEARPAPPPARGPAGTKPAGTKPAQRPTPPRRP